MKDKAICLIFIHLKALIFIVIWLQVIMEKDRKNIPISKRLFLSAQLLILSALLLIRSALILIRSVSLLILNAQLLNRRMNNVLISVIIVLQTKN